MVWKSLFSMEREPFKKQFVKNQKIAAWILNNGYWNKNRTVELKDWIWTPFMTASESPEYMECWGKYENFLVQSKITKL